MPRDGSGIYTTPAGTTAVPDTTIESSKYNGNVADVAADLNAPRPIVAGGTGATSANAARVALGAEVASQVVTNYDTHPWEAGSFKSAPGATAAPSAVGVFSGICHIYDSGSIALEAYEHGVPAIKYTRTKYGTWQSWVRVGTDADYVNTTGDTMSGDLAITKANPQFSFNKTASGQSIYLYASTNSTPRWRMDFGNGAPEGGVADGSDFSLLRFDNAGGYTGSVLYFNRATGLGEVAGNPTAPNGIATKAYADGIYNAMATTKVDRAGDTMTGNLTITKVLPQLIINRSDANGAYIGGQKSGSTRWNLLLGGPAAESGGNVGSDLAIERYSDAGGFIANALTITRLNGAVNITSTLSNTDWYNGALRVDGGIGASGDSWFNANVVAHTLRIDRGADNYSMGRTPATGTMTFSGSQVGFSGFEWYVNNAGSGYIRPLMLKNNGAMNTRYTAGTVMCDAGGDFYISSDERLKNVLAPFTRGIEALRAIGGADIFSFKHEEKERPDQRYAGFVAQKVQRAIPEAVGVSHDGMLTLDDRPLIATLMNAVLELSDRIDKLTGGKK